MNKYLFGLVFFLLSQIGEAQNNQNLFRIVEEGRFGFIDAKGKTIIPPRFRYVGDFYNGLAAAKLDSGYGFINQKGQFVIKPVYDFADDFIDTTAFVVFKNEKYLINRIGEKRPFSNEEYDLVKMNYKNTYASCDQSKVWFEKIPYHSVYRIVNENSNDTVYASFNEVEETYKEYFGNSGMERFGFRKELMLVVKQGQLCYVDTNGIVVWQANALHEKKRHKLNLDFRVALEMNCMMFPPKMEKFEGNTFGLDSNVLVAKVFPDEIAPVSENLVGMKVKLVNKSPFSDDTIILRDKYLFWNLEIKTSTGKWVAMESRAAGKCISYVWPYYLNSDTLIKFPPNNYYTFTLPAHDGTHSATFRYCFKSGSLNIYSQEFVGKYNPAQLYNGGQEFSESVIESAFGKMKIYLDRRFIRPEPFEGIKCGVVKIQRDCFE